MRTLVTGASGFLGSHVVEALRARGHSVRALVRPPTAAAGARERLEAAGAEVVEGDLLERDGLFAACRGTEGLVHCAARMGYWSRQDDAQRRVIVEGSSALLRAAHRAEVARIVHVSSIAAVGVSRDGTPMTEDWRWNGRVVDVNYANCKREAEERVYAAVRGGMPIVVANPVALLGPRLDGRPRARLVDRLAAGRVRWVPRGGSSVADVADTADGIVSALERGRVGERYLLGGPNVTWRELYGALADAVGAPFRARDVPPAAAKALALGFGALDAVGLARPPRTPEIYRAWGWYTFADSTKAREELGFESRPLSELAARAVGA